MTKYLPLFLLTLLMTSVTQAKGPKVDPIFSSLDERLRTFESLSEAELEGRFSATKYGLLLGDGAARLRLTEVVIAELTTLDQDPAATQVPGATLLDQMFSEEKMPLLLEAKQKVVDAEYMLLWNKFVNRVYAIDRERLKGVALAYRMVNGRELSVREIAGFYNMARITIRRRDVARLEHHAELDAAISKWIELSLARQPAEIPADPALDLQVEDGSYGDSHGTIRYSDDSGEGEAAPPEAAPSVRPSVAPQVINVPKPLPVVAPPKPGVPPVMTGPFVNPNAR